MPSFHEQFAVFAQTAKGPLWKEFCDNSAQAKVKAQRLADCERTEHFVFSLLSFSEVFRAFPDKRHTT